MSIKEELEKAKSVVKPNVWTPRAPKVPASAVTDQPSAQSAQAPTPSQTMNGPKGHIATIVKQTDPAQKFPFLVNCTCQFQGRAMTETTIRTTVQRHFERYE